MDTGERYELVLVPHLGQLVLELGDGFIVEILLPVEGRRAVVGEQLTRMHGAHRFGPLARKSKIRGAGFAPHHIGVPGVGNTARNRLLQAVLDHVETLAGALAGKEGFVVIVDIRGQQVCRLGVGARQYHGGHAHDVGREPRRNQLLHRFLRWNQHLAPHVPAFLDRGQLILEVNAGGTRANHVLHQFEGVEYPAETGLGVGYDRQKIVDEIIIAGIDSAAPLDFVGTAKRIVDTTHHRRHRVVGVKRLVGVHGLGGITVGGNLPTRQVNGLDSGLGLLHRLAAGQGTHAIDITFPRRPVDLPPQLLRTHPGQRVFRLHRAPQAHHVGCTVTAGYVGPAGIFLPLFLKRGDLLFSRHVVVISRRTGFNMAPRAQHIEYTDA